MENMEAMTLPTTQNANDDDDVYSQDYSTKIIIQLIETHSIESKKILRNCVERG